MFFQIIVIILFVITLSIGDQMAARKIMHDGERQVSFIIPNKLHAAMKRISILDGITLNHLFVEAIDYYIKEYDIETKMHANYERGENV